MIKLLQSLAITILMSSSMLLAMETRTVLAIGDSLTQRTDSYRSILIPMLKEKGLKFEFIGPNRDKLSRHAGYGGKNTQYLRSISKTIYQEYPADIVMIHSGHNSFSQDRPVPGIVRDTEAIINNIAGINPKAVILLAQVVTAGKLPKYSYIPELNRELAKLGARLVKEGKNVVLVNLADGFDWETDTLEDKVHVNAHGAKKMAQKWYDALLSVTRSAVPGKPATNSSALVGSLPKTKQATPIKAIRATASAVHGSYKAGNAIDGVVSDESRWVGKADAQGTFWIALHLAATRKIGGIHLYSGYKNEAAVEAFHFEFKGKDGTWQRIPSSTVSGNTSNALRLTFDTTVDVETDTLRLVVTKTHQELARIKEIVVWPDGADLPGLGVGVKGFQQAATGRKPASGAKAIPKIYLNQSGFNLGEPKRFTAPTLADGTAFGVHPGKGGEAVFTGTIRAHIGDFSAFNPKDPREYVIKAGGEESVPFTIGLWQFERIVYQRAVDFMIDSRHHVGNYTKPCKGSFGWRDDHHFAWVLRTLVPQYLSNPAAYERMPRQIKYVKPRSNLWGALEPYKEDAPDIVKLIHWGADVTVTQKTVHEFLKGELAFFLYAWPMLEPWLPRQNYDAVLKFVQANWAKEKADRKYPYDTSPEHNLFTLKTKLGSTKGELPPGHSIMPNLLMYQVAKRDNLPDADKYFDAACKQVDWIVRNLDWEDPQTTKGQRMSEHITMTSLAAFLQLCPDRDPQGLKKKIQDWAGVVVRRSDNMWDFRRLTDNGQWTPSGEKKTMWNEPGNVVGLPAALLAAAPFIEDASTQTRLRQLVWSHMDNGFGRNPCGRHFSYDAPRELEGVEHGWYSYYKGGIGQLANARFVLDGAPKHVHYPYHPEKGNYGWTEGWITFNTAFNVSLAYMARAETRLDLEQQGDRVVVRLRAPLNFDAEREEPVTLIVKGQRALPVTLKESSPNAPEHVGRVSLAGLNAKPGDRISSSYGFGYMATSASLKLK